MIQPPEQRRTALEASAISAGPQGDRLLFPLVFCRGYGQRMPLVDYDAEAEAAGATDAHVRPREECAGSRPCLATC